MVVLGGAGSLWGPIAGGVIYEYLDNRLVHLAGSEAVQRLPGAMRAPLSQPLFILGVLFILLIFFFPGGIAGVARRVRGGRQDVVLEAPLAGEAAEA